jgi:hypothetical protein
MTAIHCVVPVWGADYIDVFLDYVLPAYASDGNIPALTRKSDFQFKIYSTPEDASRLAASKIVGNLLEHVSIQFIEMTFDRSLVTSAQPYALMTLCHQHALTVAAEESAACMCMVGDLMPCDGAIANVERLVGQGKRHILSAGMRGVMEGIQPWIDSHCRTPTGQIRLEHRATIAALRATSDDYLQTLFVDSDAYSHLNPSLIALPVGARGLAVRCWHMHPILLSPRSGLSIQSTVDDNSVLEQLLQSPGEAQSVHICHGADECFFLDISRRSKIESLLGLQRAFDPAWIARWAMIHAGGMASALFQSRIYYDGGDADDACIEGVQAKLDCAVGSILESMAQGTLSIGQLRNLDQLSRDRPLYFYGSGDIGRDLLGALDPASGWNFQGFIDTFRSGQCAGYPVQTVDAYLAIRRPGDQVVITSSHVQSISERLAAGGVSDVLAANIWFQGRQLEILASHVTFETVSRGN